MNYINTKSSAYISLEDNSKANTTSSPEPTGTSIGERPSPLPAVNLIAPVETAENATVVADIETDERPVPVSAKCSSTPRTADEMVLESIQPQPQANLDNLAEETSDLEPTKHMHDTPSMLNEKDAGLEAMLLRLDQLAAKWIVVEDHINAKREQAERRKAERKKAVQERAALQDVPGISHPTTASNAGAEVIEMVGDGEVKLLKTEMEVPASQKAEAVEAPGSDTDLLKATELTRELNSSSNPMWADFIKCRDRLLQEAVTDSILMGNFNDAEIHAYSQKSKHGTVSIPIVVHAKTSFLEASSPILKELSRAENRTARFIPTIASDYDYEDDSDLEDIEDDSDLEDIEDDDRDSEISDIASNASSFDILLDSAEHLPQASREGDARVEDPSGPQKTDSPVIFMHDVAAKTWVALRVLALGCYMTRSQMAGTVALLV
ncbi:hypothetical protein BDW22DRAFT_239640 [Trametopsis cervina]|nr:hypothetical protein BDW22DRAFT_239640 [Trametopsis cervina]